MLIEDLSKLINIKWSNFALLAPMNGYISMFLFFVAKRNQECNNPQF